MIARSVLTVIAAALLVAFATWFVWPWVFRESDQATQAPLDIYLGPVRLAVPPTYVRNPDNRRSGEFAELEIAVVARDFRPAPSALILRPGAEDVASDIVFLTLREQEKTLDPAERPARLYVRFLEQEQWSHPGGLTMRRFEAASPFSREDLYMAPPEGRLFAARCMRPQQPADGLPNTCISEMRLNGVDVRLRFSPALLSDWEHLTAGVRGLMHSMLR